MMKKENEEEKWEEVNKLLKKNPGLFWKKRRNKKWVWMDIWLAQTDSYEAAAMGGGGGGWY